MNILFVDDSHTRNDFFCKKKHQYRGQAIKCVSDHFYITHAYTAQQAISELPVSPYDLVFLDHDLSKDPMNMGPVVVEYLVRKKHEFITQNHIGKIIIQSWNNAGARCMEVALVYAGYDVEISRFPVA